MLGDESSRTRRAGTARASWECAVVVGEVLGSSGVLGQIEFKALFFGYFLLGPEESDPPAGAGPGGVCARRNGVGGSPPTTVGSRPAHREPSQAGSGRVDLGDESSRTRRAGTARASWECAVVVGEVLGSSGVLGQIEFKALFFGYFLLGPEESDPPAGAGPGGVGARRNGVGGSSPNDRRIMTGAPRTEPSSIQSSRYPGICPCSQCSSASRIHTISP